MSILTPAIGASGIYELRLPFTIKPATTYTCKAIRLFEDIYRLNEDVYTLYYEPYGITPEDFQADADAGAAIITLMAVEIGTEIAPTDPQTVIYVPNTYIERFPDGDSVPYSHIVLSASLGAIPDYLDVSDTMADIGNIISEKIGVTPVVNIHKAGMSNVMTSNDHETAEMARQAAITNRNTIYTQYHDLDQLYTALLAQYNDLEASYIAMYGTNSDNVDYLNSIGYFTIDLTNNTSNDTVYVDAKFFNKIKYVMDLSAHPINSYIGVFSIAPVGGVIATIDGSGNLIFDINQAGITTPQTVVTVKVFDDNSIEIDSFVITIVFVSELTNSVFNNITIPVDLTIPDNNVHRLYFGDFVRLERLLLNALSIVDPWDPDELHYELNGSVPGITFVYGKNYVEFTVDEGLFTGNIDTNVPIVFVKRTGEAPSIVDTTATFTLHITNSI